MHAPVSGKGAGAFWRVMGGRSGGGEEGFGRQWPREERLESVGGDGGAEEIALHGVAAEVFQNVALGVGFHAFGDDFQGQGVGHVNDGVFDFAGIMAA